jgi:hypothetical protein
VVDATPDRAEPGAAEDLSDPPPYDGWDLDQQLQDIARLLAAGQLGGSQSQEADRQAGVRIHPPHAGSSAWHLPSAGKSARTSKPNPVRSHSPLIAASWAALSLGTAAFVCGAMLLGWSIVTARQELWAVGTPIALCGQITLLVGLILQLERLWHDSRRAAAKLDQMDGQLHELKIATALLSTSYNSPGGALCSHLADASSSQLLLRDLKSRLDLLASKIAVNDQ